MKNDSIIDHLKSLPEIEGEWLRIYRNSTTRSVFSSFDYVQMWYETFATPDEVRVYRVQYKSETIGFMPLVLKYNNGFRELRNLFNDHCFNPQPLILDGCDQTFQEVLLLELIKSKHSWDLLRHKFAYSFFSVPGLFNDDYLVNAHVKWAKNIEPTYTILLNKPFEEYFNMDVSKNMRQNLKRRMKMLSKTENFAFLHYTGAEAIKYWPLLLEIEGSGWKGIKGTSINTADSSVQQYYEKLLQLLARTEDLHLYFLRVGKQVVSAVFGYTENNLFHWAKVGYHEDFGQYAPSHLLLLNIIENLMVEYPGIKRLHMFPWDYGYKHRFSNEVSESIDTIVFSPTFRGKLMYVLALVKRKIYEKISALIAQVKNNWKQVLEIKDNPSLSTPTKEMSGD